MTDLSRRGFLSGLGSIIAAPAIVPFGSLMPVRGIVQDFPLTLCGVPIEFDDPMRSLLFDRIREAERITVEFFRRAFDQYLFGEYPGGLNAILD